MGHRVRTNLVVTILTATAAFAPLLPPTTNATLAGMVSDPQGTAIACGTVTVRNAASVVTRQVQTDDTESYRIYPLAAGAYDVTASVMDFQSKVASNGVIDIAANEKAGFSLEVGAVSELLNFSANAAVLQNQDATLDGTITITQTGELAGKWPQFSQGWLYSGSVPVMGTKTSGAPLYAASEFEVVS